MPAHPFIVGGQYCDRCGSYEVLEIKGDKVRIRYDTGREMLADIAMKARIYGNLLREGQLLHPHQSPAYFRTLAFLARSGEFHAEVPQKSRDAFEENYRNITGHRPILHKDKYFPIEVVKDYDKWGPELRIYFPDEDELVFPPSVQLKPGHRPGTLRINNNDYWWQLVRVGFRLGIGHDVDRIRESVPMVFRVHFDDG